MTDQPLSKEQRILRVVRFTLTSVIKDTATQPGLRHPLGADTIAGLRECLTLISERERELAGPQDAQARPRYVDEPPTPGKASVSLDALRRAKKP